MTAQLFLQSCSGGVDGIPGVVTNVTDIRFRLDDMDTLNETALIFRPQSGSVFTMEKWLRLRWEGGTGTLTNLRLMRSGPKQLVGIKEWYGERSQLQGYNVPSFINRYAVDLIPASVILTNDNDEYVLGMQQVGPWIVIQWEVTPIALAGPTPKVIYSLVCDEA